MEKPKAFVGSSVEGLPIAEEIQGCLQYSAKVNIWTQSIFRPSTFTLEALLNASENSDFGVFILTPDDIVRLRNEEYKCPRDNVIFELGLFIGKLGRERNFLITPTDQADFHLPTDIKGLTRVTFDSVRLREDLPAALGPVCAEIKKEIQRLGIVRPRFEVRSMRPGPSPIPTNSRLTAGGKAIEWIPLQHTHLTSDRIRCFYNEICPLPLPPDLARMRQERLADWEKRRTEGDFSAPHNGFMYKLIDFHTGYREIIGDEEQPVLQLKFCPTDYVTSKVTDYNIGNPIRDKYASAVDVTQQPVPEFASIVGVNLNIITSDNYLIVEERTKYTDSAANALHTSVAENLLRPIDKTSDLDQGPDVYRAAVRGIYEELGLSLGSQNIEFTTFGVQPSICEYSLIGWSRVSQSYAEVEAAHALAKDRWESNLVPVEFNPNSVATYVLTNWKRWFPIGLAAVVLSLLQAGYTKQDVDDAFMQAQSS